MRGVLARRALGAQPAQFIGSSVMTSTGSVSITKPAGTQAGDYMMIFCPYSGSGFSGSSVSSSSGGSTWNHDGFANGHGYGNHCFHKKLTSADASGSISVSSVNYAPIICVVYRGPGRALKVSEREDSGGTTWTAYHPRGKSTASMGWVQWLNDRNGSSNVATGPSGWTMRTGPNATGTFTGEVWDSLSAPPTAAGSLTWSGYGNPSNYIRTGYIYEFVAEESLTPLFFQPVIADKTYHTAGTLNLNDTSFSFNQNNVGFRGSAHPEFGSTAIYEIDITTGSSGTNFGICNASWLNAWKAAYPSSVAGAGGGIYWTSTKGTAVWYGGGTHQYGSETGTANDPSITTLNPSSGTVLGIVINGRNVRAYLNGTSYGGLVLSKDSGLGTNRMGGDLIYPFVGQWGSAFAGSFRATPSGYFNSYKLNA